MKTTGGKKQPIGERRPGVPACQTSAVNLTAWVPTGAICSKQLKCLAAKLGRLSDQFDWVSLPLGVFDVLSACPIEL